MYSVAIYIWIPYVAIYKHQLNTSPNVFHSLFISFSPNQTVHLWALLYFDVNKYLYHSCIYFNIWTWWLLLNSNGKQVNLWFMNKLMFVVIATNIKQNVVFCLSCGFPMKDHKRRHTHFKKKNWRKQQQFTRTGQNLIYTISVTVAGLIVPECRSVGVVLCSYSFMIFYCI